MTESKKTDWKEKYEKEHKLRQEAENEMVLIKGITITNSPELRAANNEINDLKNKIANLEDLMMLKSFSIEVDCRSDICKLAKHFLSSFMISFEYF